MTIDEKLILLNNLKEAREEAGMLHKSLQMLLEFQETQLAP